MAHDRRLIADSQQLIANNPCAGGRYAAGEDPPGFHRSRDRPNRSRTGPCSEAHRPYLLILPSILFLIAIELYPLAIGIYEAFLYHNRVQPWATQFIGLQNFATALRARRPTGPQDLLHHGLRDRRAELSLGLLAAVLIGQKLRRQGDLPRPDPRAVDHPSGGRLYQLAVDAERSEWGRQPGADAPRS